MAREVAIKAPEPSLIVVEHWTEALKARVPTAHR
jgi:hypothetical protein